MFKGSRTYYYDPKVYRKLAHIPQKKKKNLLISTYEDA